MQEPEPVGLERQWEWLEGPARYAELTILRQAAQADLLDHLFPGWKEHTLEKGVWLEDLLAEALRS